MTDEELIEEVVVLAELRSGREKAIEDVWFAYDGKVLRKEDLIHLREGKRIETK